MVLFVVLVLELYFIYLFYQRHL